MPKKGKWIVKCPLCGTALPVPIFTEIRKGGVIWKDGLIGEPVMAWISLCPKKDCGYMFCEESELVKHYPSMQKP